MISSTDNRTEGFFQKFQNPDTSLRWSLRTQGQHRPIIYRPGKGVKSAIYGKVESHTPPSFVEAGGLCDFTFYMTKPWSWGGGSPNLRVWVFRLI
jgi:hypothetical protein